MPAPRRDAAAAAPLGRARPAALHRPPTPLEPQQPPSPPAATALPKPSAPHSPGTHGSHPSAGQQPGSPFPRGAEEARPPPPGTGCRHGAHRARPAAPRGSAGHSAATNGPAGRGRAACWAARLRARGVCREMQSWPPWTADRRNNLMARAPAPASWGHLPTDNDNRGYRCCV